MLCDGVTFFLYVCIRVLSENRFGSTVGLAKQPFRYLALIEGADGLTKIEGLQGDSNEGIYQKVRGISSRNCIRVSAFEAVCWSR